MDIGTHGALDRARREVATIFPDRSKTSPYGLRPAVFLDRDGTVIEHDPYLSDPALVRLIPGAAEALKRLRRAGFALVLVTNQSAIGRGMLTEDRLDEIHNELNRQLAASGVTLDGIYIALLPLARAIGRWWNTQTVSRGLVCCSVPRPI